MELFASPMACSLASHITALEAGLPVKVRFVKDKKTDDGGDYYGVSAHGYVPALRLDDGRILNENASVLQYLADAKPEAGLAPAWGGFERYQLIDTLNYLGTEVHKRSSTRFLAQHAGARQAGGEGADRADAGPSRQAAGRPRHAGRRPFTVADAYLVTMLNWFAFLKVDLAKWPVLQAYHQKHLKRPSVAQAMGVEMEERKRRLAA